MEGAEAARDQLEQDIYSVRYNLEQLQEEHDKVRHAPRQCALIILHIADS